MFYIFFLVQLHNLNLLRSSSLIIWCRTSLDIIHHTWNEMPASFNFPAQFPSYKDPFDTPDTIWWWRGFWILLCRRNAKCLACLKFGNCPGFHLKCAVGTQYDRRLSTLIPQLLSTLFRRNNRHVKLHEIQMTSLMWNKWKNPWTCKTRAQATTATWSNKR